MAALWFSIFEFASDRYQPLSEAIFGLRRGPRSASASSVLVPAHLDDLVGVSHSGEVNHQRRLVVGRRKLNFQPFQASEESSIAHSCLPFFFASYALSAA